MGNKSEIEFIIAPDGNVEFTVKGAKGKQCVPIAELFKVLGEVDAEQATSEYYETEEDHVEISTQG
jgi:hypothetical protein